MTRVLFLHGLEGSPTGHKPTWLRSAGYDVTAPALDTRRLIAWLSALAPEATRDDGALVVPRAVVHDAVDAACAAVDAVAPDVVVGSSFGGGVAHLLWHEGHWRGPTVLLAPAGKKLFGLRTLSADGRCGPVAILHGRSDDVVPVDDSVALARDAGGDVTLQLVDDDHRLVASVDAGLMGALVEHVVRRAVRRG
jgi:dienelactone hydrolase